jgi:mono/diheme cytochrome c family protein
VKYYGFDWETHLITDHTITPTPVCLSWSNGADDYGVASWRRGSAASIMKELLFDPEITLIAHNMPFDAMLIAKWCTVAVAEVQREIDAGRLRDTMVREQLIQIALGGMTTKRDPRNGQPLKLGLDALVKNYLKLDISADKTDPDAWRLRYSELYEVPIEEWPDAAYDYALLDSEYALRVFAAQCADENRTSFGRLQDPDAATLIRDEIPQTRAAFDLHCMACHGPFIDQPEAERFTAYHTAEVARGYGAAEGAGLVRWNPNKYPKAGPPKSPERGGYSENQGALREAVEQDFKRRGVDVPLTAGEPPKVSIATGVLEQVQRQDIATYASTKGSQKMLSAFAAPLAAAKDQRMVSSPNVLVNTGRTSWRGPNLQQPPKKPGYRECFVPAQGNVFVSIDYDGIEMVALAQVFRERHGEHKLADAINNGYDVHAVFGAQIIGMQYDEFVAIRKDVTHEDNELVATARQAAKPFNFGRAGGMGAETFLSTLDDDVTAALQALEPDNDLISITTRLLRLWDDTWNARPFFNAVSKSTKAFPSGIFTYRHPISGRVRGNVGYCDGCNVQFQGRVADGAKNAMRLLSDWMYKADKSCKVRAWAFIHDEFLFEGPAESVTEWAAHATQLMIDGMQPYMKDVQVTAAPAAMNRWMKDADTYFEDDVLIPWDRWLLWPDEGIEPPRDEFVKSFGIKQGAYYADNAIEYRGPISQLERLGI